MGTRRRLWICVAVSLSLTGCGVVEQRSANTPIRATAVPAAETAAAASCAALTPAEQLAGARRVFVGVMLPGPTTRLGGRRVLGSPARMRVGRYLKGDGPATVRVDTAVSIGARGVTVAEDGIEPSPGQRWKIYTSARRQPFDTSTCAGSMRVTAPAQLSPGGRASVALLVWRGFPVAAEPRPIIPLGEGLVLDPVGGFHTNDQQLAYEQRRFVLRATLPGGAATVGRFHVVSAAAASRRLRAGGTTRHVRVPPLIVTAVHLGAASFLTDRGRATLPAWRFSFKGVDEPASVLALAPPDVFIPPPLHRLGPPGPGNSIEDSATMSASGRTVTISFIGAQAGTGPCDARYAVSALTSREAVAFTITTNRTSAAQPRVICTLVGYTRTAALHLTQPLGDRVLVSATDGGAVPVTPRR